LVGLNHDVFLTVVGYIGGHTAVDSIPHTSFVALVERSLQRHMPAVNADARHRFVAVLASPAFWSDVIAYHARVRRYLKGGRE